MQNISSLFKKILLLNHIRLLSFVCLLPPQILNQDLIFCASHSAALQNAKEYYRQFNLMRIEDIENTEYDTWYFRVTAFFKHISS